MNPSTTAGRNAPLLGGFQVSNARPPACRGSLHVFSWLAFIPTGLLYEQFEAFQITLLSPFWAGVNPALVDQNVDRVEPGNFALEFIVMSLHELI